MTETRTAYLVLGMHRSGTSAVTQLLGLAGAKLPAHVMPGDTHNAKGYFEPWRIAMFNDERLRASGGAWDDVFGFPFRPLARKDERKWLVRGEALFEEEYGQVAYPLLKDPRVTVLAPFWRTLLDDLNIAARCVIPVRHPLAVAGSLARRDGFPPEKSVLLWTSYMLAAEAYTRDIPRVFVDYDSLLGDWRAEVARIEAAHGAPLPKLNGPAAKKIDDFLTPELRHNPSQGDLQALGWAGQLAQAVFEEMAAAASDRPVDSARLADVAAELEQQRARVGALVSPVTSEADRLRFALRQEQDEVLRERQRAAELLAESDKRREIEVTDLRDALNKEQEARDQERDERLAERRAWQAEREKIAQAWAAERETWAREQDAERKAWAAEREAMAQERIAEAQVWARERDVSAQEKAALKQENREIRKAGKREVEVRERELRVFYDATAEAERMIDEAIAKP